MAASSKTDIEKTGRVNTTVETKTEVVDNTAAPVDGRHIDYEVSEETLPNGTIRHTIGEPVGGFPESNEDA